VRIKVPSTVAMIIMYGGMMVRLAAMQAVFVNIYLSVNEIFLS
jgi:hypothetical protein